MTKLVDLLISLLIIAALLDPSCGFRGSNFFKFSSSSRTSHSNLKVASHYKITSNNVIQQLDFQSRTLNKKGTQSSLSLKQSEAVEVDPDYIDEEALIKRINDEVFADSGFELEDLINPSKVVNLERDIIKLNNRLALTSDAAEINALNEKLTKKQSVLTIEKRAVMRGWLKNLFVGQSILAGIISFGMVYDLFPGYKLDLSIRVLGFWMWWLFIVPSLRARKPGNKEKEALNWAFLLTPVVSVATPTLTKDVAVIWWVNAAVVAACYAYAYLLKLDAVQPDGEAVEQSSLPKWVVQAIKALDYGSGQERGARRE